MTSLPDPDFVALLGITVLLAVFFWLLLAFAPEVVAPPVLELS